MSISYLNMMKRAVGNNTQFTLLIILNLLFVLLLSPCIHSRHLGSIVKNNNNHHNTNNNNNVRNTYDSVHNIHNNNFNNNNNNNDGPQEYSNSRSKTQEEQSVDPAVYLQKLGYLPGSDLETGALRTEDEFSGALKGFQKFANVPLTGKLDADTLVMMKKSRCGVQDILEGSTDVAGVQNLISSNPPSSTDPNAPLGYVLGPSKWQKKWITYRLLNYSADLDRQQTKEAIRRAFTLWSDTADLTFEAKENGYADIYVLFAKGYHQDGYPFDRTGGTLAHAFFPGDDKGGDVHFDDDESWTLKSTNGTNLFIVGAHEIGHALGLAHSYDQQSLMYPWYKGYTPDYRLSYDDIYAIQTIYGAKSREKNKPVDRTAPTTSTTTTTTTTTHPTITTKISRKTTTRKTLTTTKHHHHHHHTPKVNPDLNPKDCDLSVDAISMIRSEYFFFKGMSFTRFNKVKNLTSQQIKISMFWRDIPASLKKLDAVFEIKNHAYFFSGKRYWKYYGTDLDSLFPRHGRPITDFNLPASLDKIDAAFKWDHNGRVYLISGDMYWRLNEKNDKVDYGYPRDMSMWGGVKLPVDAAFTDNEGITYFFSGPHFWPFNNARMQVRHKHPLETATHWLKCPPRSYQSPTLEEAPLKKPATNSANIIPPNVFTLAIAFVGSFVFF